MIVEIDASNVASQIEQRFPSAVEDVTSNTIVIKGNMLLSVAHFLKDTPSLDFSFLNTLVGTDYLDYIEVVYFLESITHQHKIYLKVRIFDREHPIIPSVVSLWKSADYQEREIFDLLGVTFKDHPNMKRIVMWQGFEGHPLRRDFL